MTSTTIQVFIDPALMDFNFLDTVYADVTFTTTDGRAEVFEIRILPVVMKHITCMNTVVELCEAAAQSHADKQNGEVIEQGIVHPVFAEIMNNFMNIPTHNY